MNKLFTKIATLSVGLAMAVGVGVAVGNNKGMVAAHAANPGSSIYTSGTPSWGTSYSYGSRTLNGVDWYVTTYGNNNSIGWNKATQDKSGDADFGPLTQSDSSYGMYQTSGDFTNAQKISVSVTNTDAQIGSYSVLYSTNSGSTWTSAKTGSVTTTKGSSWSIEYDHGSKIGDSVRFAFGVYGNTNTTTTRLSITQIEVWQAATASYTVSFNSNGGSGSMSSVSDVSGNYTLPACTFTAPSNKAFAGWKANNAGTTIAVGGSYTVSADVTFYAQWADAYTVTYSAGSNGSGSYAHTSQPAGTYVLLPFVDLTGVSASTGYKFKNYTVGGVDKNPGDTITLSAATAVTVNFEVKPEETTYNFATNFSTYASGWTTTYGSKTLAGTTDVGGDYAATIVLGRANKQTGGTIPTLAAQKNSTFQNMIVFTLTETGKKIKNVVVTFTQRSSNTPTLNLFKGSDTTATGITSIDSATIGTKSTLSANNLNDVSFSVNCVASGSSNNCSVDLSSIYISIENQAAYGTTDHIKVTSFPNTVYHIGETYDGTGLAVTAYDGSDETTANFKDVTASVATGFTSGVYTFDDGDVPTAEMFVEYTESATTFSADPIVMHVYALAEYQLVESAPADWSGNYLIVATNSEDELRAMNGALATLDVEGNHKSAVEKSTGLIENGQELEFTIASYDTGYSIQGKDGKYIGWASNSGNGLTASDTPLVNTLSYDNGVVIAGSGGRHLTFNNDGQGRFRYYTSGTVQLYKLVESDDASDYADMFLETLSTGTNAVCKYNESTHVVSTDLADLKDAWKDLADLYDVLSAADKEQFRLGVASSDPSATNIAKALALYDHIATAYGTRLQGEEYVSNYNFMARSITPVGNSIAFFGENNTASTTSIMVIISIVSLTAIGGYFFLRKRKVQ